jgi:hypothetical protein
MLIDDISAIATTHAKAPNDFSGYRDDPVRFCREVLGFEPWTRQEDILRAVASNTRVCAVSGHSVGKTRTAAALALWFMATRPRSRTILLAPRYEQIQQGVYREIKLLALNARVPLIRALEMRVGDKAATGIVASDSREIFGTAPGTPVALQGIRAADMLVLVDEASGLKDDVMDAMLSLLAGGGHLALFGNPLATIAPYSFFYKAWRSGDYHNLQISSTETPNYLENRIVVPGLAVRSWVLQRAADYGGETSPLYKQRILGEFVPQTEGQIFGLDMLNEAVARHESTKASGRLVIGCDPAGSTGKGDSSAFVARRGQRVLDVVTRTGLTPAGHVVEIAGLIGKYGTNEGTIVAVDCDGSVGKLVKDAVHDYLQTRDAFDFREIHGGALARQKRTYHKRRDELYLNLLEAFNAGLSIPEHPRLIGELSIIKAEQNRRGLSEVSEKEEMRKALNGRSPDCADALALTYAVTANDDYVSAAADVAVYQEDRPPPHRC